MYIYALYLYYICITFALYICMCDANKYKLTTFKLH